MIHWTQEISIGTDNVFADDDSAAAIAEFIRTKGITRCPSACVLPTQGLVAAADQVALEEHAVARDRLRRAQAAARWRPFLKLQGPTRNIAGLATRAAVHLRARAASALVFPVARHRFREQHLL